jgi:cell division protein FtsB
MAISVISNSTIRHFPCCTPVAGVVLFFRVSKDLVSNGGAQTKARRGTRALKATAAPRSRRIVRWLLLFVACVIVVDSLVGDRGLVAMLRARHEYDALAATIAHERAENAELREEARRLREDPAAVEEIARRELGLIRPGEKVFIVKDVPPPKP